MLIATHADSAEVIRDSRGEMTSPSGSALFTECRQHFEADLAFCWRLFVINSTAPHSVEIKSLKNYLKELKTRMVEVCCHLNTVPAHHCRVTFSIGHTPYLTNLFSLRLIGRVGARNYVRSSFSQWELSMTRT